MSAAPSAPPPLDGRHALRSVRRCLGLLEGGERRRWAMLLPLALLAAGMEAAGAALIFTLIRFISAPDSLSETSWLRRMQDALQLTERGHFLVVFAAAVAGFYVVKNAVLIFQTYYTARCAGLSVDSLSNRLLYGYLRAPYRYHLERNSAQLIRNANEAVVSAYRSMLMSLVHAVSEATLLVALLGVLVMAAPTATLIAVGVVGVMILGFLRATQTRMVRWGFESHQLYAHILAQLTQSLAGIKEVKVLGRERHFLATFAQARGRMSQLGWRRGTLENTPRLMMETFFVLAVVAVILVFDRRGSSQAVVPVLGLFAYTGFRLLPGLNRIVAHVNMIRFGSTAIDEIWEDAQRFGALDPEQAPAPVVRLPFRDRIEVRDLTFSYSEARGPALAGLDLTLRRGESVGIVGATGAGKSTFVDLLLGLLEPSQGKLTVDGVDIRTNLRGWQANLGYVPQSIYLIDDTLRRNIALGIPDAEIDEARVRSSAALAQLEGLIGQLPAGLDTVVGERGVRLSGGERQRVAIARALYQAPEVLVFDEATSSLDNKTEREITRAIEGFRGEKTVIVVAHRLSTVRGCDRILLLQQGRIVAQGPYEALLAENDVFRELARVEPAERP
jgi:ABC-type multidrug transport system fused ATPase/permease subunit